MRRSKRDFRTRLAVLDGRLLVQAPDPVTFVRQTVGWLCSLIGRFSVVHVGVPEWAVQSLDVVSSLSFLWTMASSEPFAVDLDGN